MTKDEYRAAIEGLGVNQLQAGRMLGLSPRQAQRLASGESPVPKIVERFLGVMTAFEITWNWRGDWRSKEPSFVQKHREAATMTTGRINAVSR
jgi:hypothetical protein